MAKLTTDDSIFRKIESLVHEEQHLYKKSRLTDHDQVRLEDTKVELDQCWDLLRQRDARREFGQDPNEAKMRPVSVVERAAGSVAVEDKVLGRVQPHHGPRGVPRDPAGCGEGDDHGRGEGDRDAPRRRLTQQGAPNTDALDGAVCDLTALGSLSITLGVLIECA